jgi:SAM-dependent methyltransferase
MLENPIEYQRMNEAEHKLWWYKALHTFVLESIQKEFSRKDITIVDAGCGTGGLMSYLNRCSFQNISGFDISPHALSYCKAKGLNVFEGNLLNIAQYFQKDSVDVIISNDNLYFLSEAERAHVFLAMNSILRAGGVLILNLPAFNAFRGTHDLGVGIKKRFSKKDIHSLLKSKNMAVIELKYWPFILSPLIFFIRTFQRIKIKLFKIQNAVSDVELPNEFLNSLFYKITLSENRFKAKIPWGSSLFTVLKKINN